MRELIAFVDSREKNPTVRILPIFSTMVASDVRDNLRDEKWKKKERTQMFKDSNHKNNGRKLQIGSEEALQHERHRKQHPGP